MSPLLPLALALVATASIWRPSKACSGILINTSALGPNAVVAYARTMDFDADFNSAAVWLPRRSVVPFTPLCQPNCTWTPFTLKYGIAGITINPETYLPVCALVDYTEACAFVLTDEINEAGLGVSLQWDATAINQSNPLFHPLPGDYSSQGRFQRLALLNEALGTSPVFFPNETFSPDFNGTGRPGQTEMILALDVITKNVLAPGLNDYGSMGIFPGGYGVTEFDRTQWTVLRDHTNIVLYYKSAGDPMLSALNVPYLAKRRTSGMYLLPLNTYASSWFRDTTRTMGRVNLTAILEETEAYMG